MLEKIGAFAFDGTGLRTITIPKSVYWIGGTAFAHCKHLEYMDIPDNIEQKSNGMFEECRELKRVDLHENLRSIGDRVFFGCSSLDILDIPDSVEQIGKDAFTGTDKQFIIQCSVGSCAEEYARKNKLKYQLV